jgi:hypothetical protein
MLKDEKSATCGAKVVRQTTRRRGVIAHSPARRDTQLDRKGGDDEEGRLTLRNRGMGRRRGIVVQWVD